MMSRTVILYGFDVMHRVQLYWCMDRDGLSIEGLIETARMMMERIPAIKIIYAIDNKAGLRKDYMDTIKHRDFVRDIEFKDEIEREGLRILER